MVKETCDRRFLTLGARALLLVALLPASLSCGLFGGPKSPKVPTTTPAASPTTATSSSKPTPFPSPACGAGLLKDCFASSGEMRVYLELVAPLVEQYFAEAYPLIRKPQIRFARGGESGPTACPDERGRPELYTDTSYSYCSLDGTIYLGEQQVWKYYKEAGDIAPAVGLAHEWGHHIQRERGIPTNAPIQYENQADCLAGGWIGYLASRDLIGRQDQQSIDRLIAQIASADAPGRGHGTLTERQSAVNSGFTGVLTRRLISPTPASTGAGLGACNRYFPTVPISP